MTLLSYAFFPILKCLTLTLQHRSRPSKMCNYRVEKLDDRLEGRPDDPLEDNSNDPLGGSPDDPFEGNPDSCEGRPEPPNPFREALALPASGISLPQFSHFETQSTTESQSTHRCSVPNPVTPPIAGSFSSSVVSGLHTSAFLIRSTQCSIWPGVEWKGRVSGSKKAPSRAATPPWYRTQ